MMANRKFGIAAAVLLLAALPASAAEMAVLNNGRSLRVERHEPREANTRLYLSGDPGNYVDVPTADILKFEEIDVPAVPVIAPEPAPADTLDALVSAASSRNRIDPDLIYSVIRAESGFNANAVSPKGAQGLMQLMPETAASLGVQDALNPADNVEGGTRYLRDLLDFYHDDLLKTLAAYNAGPERVEQYKGVPPYRETRAYVTRIVTDFNRKKIAQRGGQADRPASHPSNVPSKAATTDKTNGSRPAGDAPSARTKPLGSMPDYVD